MVRSSLKTQVQFPIVHNDTEFSLEFNFSFFLYLICHINQGQEDLAPKYINIKNENEMTQNGGWLSVEG